MDSSDRKETAMPTGLAVYAFAILGSVSVVADAAASTGALEIANMVPQIGLTGAAIFAVVVLWRSKQKLNERIESFIDARDRDRKEEHAEFVAVLRAHTQASTEATEAMRELRYAVEGCKPRADSD